MFLRHARARFYAEMCYFSRAVMQGRVDLWGKVSGLALIQKRKLTYENKSAMTTRKGKIVIQPGVNVWPHELKTAEALAAAGHTVEFIKRSENRYDRSADVLMDDIAWELKAPKSDKLHMVEQNLRRALK